MADGFTTRRDHKNGARRLDGSGQRSKSLIESSLIQMDEQVCLNCALDDCDESNKGCLLWSGEIKPHQRYYAKKRLDPEFRKKKYAAHKKRRQTEAGKKEASRHSIKWQKRYPEKYKAIKDRYLKKNRDRILAVRRKWKATESGQKSVKRSREKYRAKQIQTDRGLV